METKFLRFHEHLEIYKTNNSIERFFSFDYIFNTPSDQSRWLQSMMNINRDLGGEKI
jgi:hypothetical protein